MADDFIEYWLPTSVLRARGAVVHDRDRLFPHRLPTSRARVELTLDVVADKDVPRGQALPIRCVAQIRRGALQDTNVSLDLTEDGRLAPGGAASPARPALLWLSPPDGALDATLAGWSAGNGAADDASPTVGGVHEYDRLVVPDEDRLRRAIAESAETDDEGRVEVALLLEQPRAAVARKYFANLALRLLDEVTKALAEVERAGAAEDRHRKATIRLLSCQNALGVARAELTRLDAAFETWRSGKIGHVAEPVDLTIPIRELLEARPVDGVRGVVGRRLSSLLQKLGVWPVVEELEPTMPGRLFDESVITLTGGPRIAPGVILRQPRSATLAIYQYHVDGRPSPWPHEPYGLPSSPEAAGFRLVDRRRCLIVDRECRHEFVRFRMSAWGKRGARVTLSALGGLRSYATHASPATDMPEPARPAAGSLAPLPHDGAWTRDASEAYRTGLPDPEIAELRSRIAATTGELALARAEAAKAQILALESLEDEASRPTRSVRKRRRAELTA